ncbi:MAG: serpin family protein [Myxococcota bacterium]
MRTRCDYALILAPVLSLAGLAGCGVAEPPTDRSQLSRLVPAVDAAELSAAVDANTNFAIDLHRKVVAPGRNVITSGYSITSALSMLWGGSAGTTEIALAHALGLPFAQAKMHPLLNRIESDLLSRNDTVGDFDRFELHVTNDLWAQLGFEALPSYLDLLATQYGAGVRRLDFAKKPEAARQTINDWVAAETHNRIQDLLPEGSVTPDTVLALTNAVYFKAKWQEAFDPASTQPAAFTRDDASTVQAPFMHRIGDLPSLKEDGLTAVELPYAGEELAMLVLMPADLAQLEADLSAEKIAGIVARLHLQSTAVALPKWQHALTLNLKPLLTELGAGELFDPSTANLSGIDGKRDLFVQAAVHKAFVLVDESGTEAAAATGITVGRLSAEFPELDVRFDHPFVYLLRDRRTGTVVFMGRVVDPTSPAASN